MFLDEEARKSLIDHIVGIMCPDLTNRIHDNVKLLTDVRFKTLNESVSFLNRKIEMGLVKSDKQLKTSLT